MQASDSTISIPASKASSGSVFTLSDFNSHNNLTEKPKLGNDYLPSEHRDQIRGQSTCGAFAHFLKGSLGTGLLAMPLAFYNGGLLFGAIATLAMGYICAHCIHILVKTSQELCKTTKVPALGFAETVEKIFENGPQRFRSWSYAAKYFIDYGLMATYFGTICIYMVFIATSFHDVFNYHFGLNWDVRIYIGICILPCLLIAQIRNLKWLVPFSAAANLFIIITFIIVLYYLFNQPLDFTGKTLVAHPTQIPLFFATVIFAMEGIGTVFPVENDMKNPDRFLGCPGVLNVSMFTVVGLYAVIGFLGYVRYGDDVRGSVTLNLAEGDILADAAKLLMALAILFTYGLQFYVPMEILWKKIEHKFEKKNHNMTQILLRSGIILISSGVSVVVPNLEPFISLVGSVFLSLLGLFVPAFCELIYLWPDRLGFAKWRLYKNILLCILAVCALVAGSAASIGSIIKIYEE